jgi:hypothetical protein
VQIFLLVFSAKAMALLREDLIIQEELRLKQQPMEHHHQRKDFV